MQLALGNRETAVTSTKIWDTSIEAVTSWNTIATQIEATTTWDTIATQIETATTWDAIATQIEAATTWNAKCASRSERITELASLTTTTKSLPRKRIYIKCHQS